MNNKSIKLFLLLGLALLSTKGYSENRCNDASSNKNCVQILVESNTGQALKDLVVYLEPLDGQLLEPNLEHLVINQEGRAFSPYISVSQVNSDVNFVNKDDITHHIYSAGSENKFSFKIKSGETNASVEFNQPAEVAMGCNIHDWMSGYLLVVNTPYFAKTNTQGYAYFDITELGKYKIVVWHPQMKSTDNRMIQEASVLPHSQFSFKLKNEMAGIPLQESDDDFDFLSDYE
ncbi:hypothetical protein Q4506_09720 [Colwellia sp. 4_MG-2023]|uniref:hypothetical protein n=1 Tax=unclassified Colwellia TaxID=196834 RepID=UPI001C08F789|nr:MULTISPECIES: hypothetical protein [unclassified Colwellia]MBU2926159.1 hypothetical protein [Colwellia sp. C2M11]MDO6507125.1 hypothetical protein [Colwellia sp. 5_MG-2023]MDO6555961.1 hypothetical protein [Colwellia sp. 4_MG-2023]MDO6652420.1 hypothetical protein [Colwellia sp. 3_MG-2023]MDO6665705.1 hypothetical protein [Colwellia sp. 2_MG-2023]